MKTRDARKRRRQQRERSVQSAVKTQVADRDRWRCRFPEDARWLLPCNGPLEWAHLTEKRRARTVGQAPEERHTTSGSMLLCRRHHAQYDQFKLFATPVSPDRGADGELSWSDDRYRELGVS